MPHCPGTFIEILKKAKQQCVAIFSADYFLLIYKQRYPSPSLHSHTLKITDKQKKKRPKKKA